MGGSNDHWGALEREDPATAALWDQGLPLPEKGSCLPLDALLKSKHLTRDALARTGARLLTNESATLIWCWPGGAKFRNLETGRRWNSVDPRWRRVHIMPPFDGRSGTVLLLGEGETDSARLSLLYPFASVGVLPLGADFIPAELAEQASAFDAVYACHDADEAGDHGAAWVQAAVPQAVRHRPPAPDWCELPAGAEAPPLPKAPDACGSIVFSDFATLLEEGVPEPRQLIPDVLYESGVHWLSGEPGCGKTTLAAAWAIQVMALGLHVVWLDFEGGAGPTVRRFQAAGLQVPLARERFHYAGWPTNAEDSLAAVAARWPGAMVVFDSASKAQSLRGIDENANTEVTKWTMSLVRAAKEHLLPLVVIDHITKGGASSAYARGAGAKQADTDVHWRVQTVTTFDRNNAGVVALKRSKDRDGYFPAAQWFAVGDGCGLLPVTPCEQPTEAPPTESRTSAF